MSLSCIFHPLLAVCWRSCASMWARPSRGWMRLSLEMVRPAYRAIGIVESRARRLRRPSCLGVIRPSFGAGF